MPSTLPEQHSQQRSPFYLCVQLALAICERKIDNKKVANKQLIDGDIILEKSGGSDNQPVGRVVFFDNGDDIYLCNNFTQALRVNKALAYSKYAFYFMFYQHKCGVTELLQNKTTGIRNLQLKSYMSLKIPIPPIATQKKIADILDKASELIEKREAQIEKLDELTKSIFIDMFGDPVTIKKWNFTEVQEVANVKVGVVIKPAQYYTDSSNGIKAFRSLNIDEFQIKADNWVCFTPGGHAANNKSILKKGDVLVIRSGYPGRACVVTEEYDGCNAIDIIIATPKSQVMNSMYLCAYTNFPYGKNQILQGQHGAAQVHFNVGSYNKMKIALPPLSLQNQFADCVEMIEHQKFLLQQSLEKFELNYKSIMQKCFNDEL